MVAAADGLRYITGNLLSVRLHDSRRQHQLSMFVWRSVNSYTGRQRATLGPDYSARSTRSDHKTNRPKRWTTAAIDSAEVMSDGQLRKHASFPFVLYVVPSIGESVICLRASRGDDHVIESRPACVEMKRQWRFWIDQSIKRLLT